MVSVGSKLRPPITTTKAPSRPSATKISAPTLTSIDRWLMKSCRRSLDRAFRAAVDELRDHRIVAVAEVLRSAQKPHFSLVQHHDAIRDAEDGRQIVGDHDAR